MATHKDTPGARRGGAGQTGSGAGLTQQTSGQDFGATPVGEESGFGSGVGADTGATSGFDDDGAGASRDSGTGPRTDAQPEGVVAQVKQQASTKVNEQKERAVAGLGSVASAVRQASDHLRTDNHALAAYADRAVDQIQTLADRLRDKDPAAIVHDLEGFARRRPAAFVGGAFLLGLGLARFLKSTGQGGPVGYNSGGRSGGSRPGPSSSSLSLPADLSRSDDLARGDDFSRADLTRQGGLAGADIPRPGDAMRPTGGLSSDPGVTS